MLVVAHWTVGPARRRGLRKDCVQSSHSRPSLLQYRPRGARGTEHAIICIRLERGRQTRSVDDDYAVFRHNLLVDYRQIDIYEGHICVFVLICMAGRPLLKSKRHSNMIGFGMSDIQVPHASDDHF